MTGGEPRGGDVVDALDAQQDELDALLAPLDAAQWQLPSLCAGWTIADVVIHLAQTNEMAVGSVHGRFNESIAALSEGLGPAATVDDGVELMVARDRGTTAEALLARWRASAAAQVDALRSCDPHARLQWVAGDVSATTLTTTRLSETWIHAGDIAHGLGVELATTDRLWHIARLAWRTVPYAFARAGRPAPGPVAFDLDGPNGASWRFVPDGGAPTTIRGDALDLCRVAGQRATADGTSLHGEGPDAAAVLELVRTYA